MLSKRYGCVFTTRRPYDKIPIPEADRGDIIEGEFRVKRDDHFNAVYEKVGEKDVQEYINSFKTGCSLKAILDRCSLMPTAEKVRYLQQTEQGLSADLTAMPKDGTEAQIMMSRLKAVFPDFAQRLKNGESFDAVFKELIAPPVAKKEESEVVNDVETK